MELAGRADVARLLGAEPGRRTGGGAAGARPLPRDDRTRGARLRTTWTTRYRGRFPAGRLARSRTFSDVRRRDSGDGRAPGRSARCGSWPGWSAGAADRARYDLVILDGPASGQLLGLLTRPADLPLDRPGGSDRPQTANIEELFKDPGAPPSWASTTPEQMAVTEALALGRAALAGALARWFRRAADQQAPSPSGETISGPGGADERARGPRRRLRAVAGSRGRRPT